MKVLVTGASGFIASAFIRHVSEERQDLSIVGLVRNSDQRNMLRLTMSEAVRKRLDSGRLRLVYGDLCGDISGICEGIDVVIGFGARTFVDHSLRDVTPFLQSNVVGTVNLLEDARRHKVKRFYQISTDEVLGSILVGSYTEKDRMNPTNPYAASKAAADAFAISYAHSFGMHTTITRTENNAGPWQHPQKVFPTFVKKALAGEKLPVYGDGKHRRQWLWVGDHIDAILHLMACDYDPGQVFHVAGNQELENLELAQKILCIMDMSAKVFPNKLVAFEERLEFLDDHNIRPGHDRRYSLDCSKLKAMGWTPRYSLDRTIEETTKWYLDHEWWLR